MTAGAHDAKRLRIGMYQRYRGGNMDEGWTRLALRAVGVPVQRGLRRGDPEGQPQREVRRVHLRRRLDRRPSRASPPAAAARARRRGVRERAEHHAARVPERDRRRGRQRHQGLRRRRAARWSTLGGATDVRHHQARAARPQRRGGPRREGVLLPRLDAPRAHRQHAPAGVRHAGGGPRAVPLQPGLRRGGHRLQRPERHRRALCRPRRRAQRMAERGAVHRGQDGDGLRSASARARSC
ncbi:MAG: hypothetical protein MZW92_40480 [Comamonadaceae bacterium]|nr:hypothetical protein [Comamonadaceae bacterium]